MTTKSTRGGSRPGAGRKKKAETTLLAVRVEKETLAKARSNHGRKLHGMIVKFITQKAE